jgi:diacylglycerol kinase family enzyme
LADGIGRIVIAGGDGTIHEAINGIAPHFDRVELAILPCGTANDLARTLEITPVRFDLIPEHPERLCIPGDVMEGEQHHGGSIDNRL